MSDLELRAGSAVLHVDTLGGGMRSLSAGEWEILDGYDAGQPHSGRRGHVLAPWPSRISGGRYRWADDEHQLALTDSRHRAAAHGLVDKVEWTVEQHEGDAARLAVTVPSQEGYPFDVRVTVGYRLSQAGLDVALAAENRGGEPAPFGIGMHPYFRCGADADDTSLRLPVRSRLVLDEDGTPTGDLEDLDGNLGTIGDQVLDLVARREETLAEAPVEISGPAGTLRLGLGPSFRWLVVFTGDTLPEGERRRAVAVEPLTCPPNAFASSTDVIALGPGTTWSDHWSLSWTGS